MQSNDIRDGGDARHTLHGIFGTVLLKQVTRVSRKSYNAVFNCDKQIRVIHERMTAELGFDRMADLTVRFHGLLLHSLL